MRILDNQIVKEIAGGVNAACLNDAVELVQDCTTSELAQVTQLLNQIIVVAQSTGASVNTIEKMLIGTLQGLLGIL